MTDFETRLAAIEQRAEGASDAWERGDVGALRVLTLDDVPWLLKGVRLLLDRIARIPTKTTGMVRLRSYEREWLTDGFKLLAEAVEAVEEAEMHRKTCRWCRASPSAFCGELLGIGADRRRRKRIALDFLRGVGRE